MHKFYFFILKMNEYLLYCWSLWSGTKHVFSFIGIPSRKINNNAGPPADVRTGQNCSESEIHGGGVQPTLAGTGEGTVRLGEGCQS